MLGCGSECVTRSEAHQWLYRNLHILNDPVSSLGVGAGRRTEWSAVVLFNEQLRVSPKLHAFGS